MTRRCLCDPGILRESEANPDCPFHGRTGVLHPDQICLRDDPGDCPHHGRHGDAPTGVPGHCFDAGGQWWHKPGECRLYGEPHDCCRVRLPVTAPQQEKPTYASKEEATEAAIQYAMQRLNEPQQETDQ